MLCLVLYCAPPWLLGCPELHAALRRSSSITWMKWAILNQPEIAGGEEQGIKLVGMLHSEQDGSRRCPSQAYAWNMPSRAENME